MTSKSALPGDNYILSFQKLPKNVEAKIAAAGGTVRVVLGKIDAVLVTAESADFLTTVKGMTGLDVVIPDATMNWLPDLQKVEFVVEPEHIGSDEPFYARYQWDVKAIDAPGAWNAGYTGEGVRVAVLDTGVDVNHPDLMPNINFELSKSYVPEEPYIDDMHGHGSNVAGIIAATDNGVGVISVAPNAEIIALKVLSGTGSGDFGWMLEAILYAVECDVDIVNMSLGAYMDKGGFYDDDGTWVAANEVAGFLNLVKKTVNYATQQGVLIIASAGATTLSTAKVTAGSCTCRRTSLRPCASRPPGRSAGERARRSTSTTSRSTATTARRLTSRPRAGERRRGRRSVGESRASLDGALGEGGSGPRLFIGSSLGG